MKVLVTGGCGFLGSNVAAHFLGSGDTVVVIDALFRTGSEANRQWLATLARADQFTFYRADVAEADAVAAIFQREGTFDYICHLAGQVAMTTSLADPRRDLMTNVVGTFNILEAARQYMPGTFIAYSSTNKVYGDLERLRYEETATRYVLADYASGLDETTPLDFASPYGCSKGSADQYVHDWFRNYGLRTVVFRHSSIFGGRQYATFDQGWIGWFCSQALLQRERHKRNEQVEPFTIAGTGKQVRDVLHAHDLVALYRAAFEKRDSIAGEVFNIGGGMANSLSLLELFELLRGELGISLSYRQLPPRASDQKVFVADIRKARARLGWEPEVGKVAGIRRMLDWVQDAAK